MSIGTSRLPAPESAVRTPLPALLRWAGSKRQMVDNLARYWPGVGTRYVEPFVGSACLFFHIRPVSAVLSDINEELITAYSVIVSDPDAVHAELSRLGPRSRETYYRIRGWAPERLSATRRAARFLYLNRYCFNGLYRTDVRGRFNVPIGATKVGAIPSLEQLRTYAAALEPAELVTSDFESTVRSARTGDFVYLDPPYAVSTQWRRGHHYTGDGFAMDDLSRLRSALEVAAHQGARFLLSYADSPEGLTLAEGFHVERIIVRRSIAGSALRRVSVTELLVSNHAPQGEKNDRPT